MKLSTKIAELVRVSMIQSLTEKRASGKITPKKYKVLVEAIENCMDRQILESTVLCEDGEKKKFWIQKAIKKPGALHAALGVPKGKKIPAKKLKVHAGDSPKLKKEKVLAKTLKKISAKRKG